MSNVTRALLLSLLITSTLLPSGAAPASAATGETATSADGSTPAGVIALEQIEEANVPTPVPAAGEPLGDLPGAGHTFKIRIGSEAFRSKHYVVGTQPVVDVIKVRRFEGTGVEPISVSYEIVEGDPASWTVSILPAGFDLGPLLTRSSGDADDPGTIPGRQGDGDIDDDDLAAFDRYFTGAGVPIPKNQAKIGPIFDFDGDLDVDEADRAVLLSQYTGPVVVPWNREPQIQIAAAAALPQEATARIRITATDTRTGEAHSIFAHVTKRALQPSLAMWTYISTVEARSTQLARGMPVTFFIGLSNLGAASGMFDVRPVPVTGFGLSVINPLGIRTSTFLLSAQSDPKKIRLVVTPPANWPIGARQTITLQARAPSTGATASLDVNLINGGALWNPSDLLQPTGRRHRVHPGSTTSFRMLVTNPSGASRTLGIDVQPLGSGSPWPVVIQPPTMTLAAGAESAVLVSVTPPADAAAGTTLDWDVRLLDTAAPGAAPLGINRVGAEVSNRRRVYFFAMDGADPDLVKLDKKGTGPGGPGNWLMPRTRAFLDQATGYPAAHGAVPYVTDPNHLSALSGSFPGTTGINNVLMYYGGRDADGSAIGLSSHQAGTAMMHYGPDGARVQTLFDVAKQQDPSALNAVAMGKGWVKFYVRPQEGGSADIVLDGQEQPPYIDPCKFFVMGDPVSDSDPIDPPSYAYDFLTGLFPDDRWTLNGALSIVDTEDPEMMYILLGSIDDMSHAYGGVADLGDWDDRGTKTTWDDRNRINPAASREDVLDVVREADDLFGLFLDHLAARGELDDSYIVLLSDHSEVTHNAAFLDVASLLESRGYSNGDDFRILSGSGLGMLYDLAPQEVQHVEEILETAPSIAPGLDHNPWIVLNRQEMQTGIDTRTGRVFSDPNELYSEYLVGREGTPGLPYWPSLVLLADSTWEIAFAWPIRGEDDVITVGPFKMRRGYNGGHGGPATAPTVLALSGPGIPRGHIVPDPVRTIDIAPTLYRLLGWPAPANVQGQPLPDILPTLARKATPATRGTTRAHGHGRAAGSRPR